MRRGFLNVTVGLGVGLFAFGIAAEAHAASVPIPGGWVNVKRKSLVDLRFNNVVRQSFDLSCGAAAVATLLTYYYGDKVAEKEIIEKVVEFGDKAKIQKDGFSMLELKQYGDQRGYVVRGFEVKSAAALEKLQIPVVTLINTNGYSHFVVVKGVRDGRVFYADPAFGNVSKPLETFEKGWRKVILVYLSRDRKPENQFALKAALKAPISQVRYVIDRYLQTIRPMPGEF